MQISDLSKTLMTRHQTEEQLETPPEMAQASTADQTQHPSKEACSANDDPPPHETPPKDIILDTVTNEAEEQLEAQPPDMLQDMLQDSKSNSPSRNANGPTSTNSADSVLYDDSNNRFSMIHLLIHLSCTGSMPELSKGAGTSTTSRNPLTKSQPTVMDVLHIYAIRFMHELKYGMPKSARSPFLL